MCMYSSIGDQWKDKFPEKWPKFVPYIPEGDFVPSPFHLPPEISRAEFEALKKEVEELKKLIKAAVAFDKATGQPHCEVEDKVKLIKKIANMVGVDMKDLMDEQ